MKNILNNKKKIVKINFLPYLQFITARKTFEPKINPLKKKIIIQKIKKKEKPK